MAVIKPFRALKPRADKLKEVAALPYDVYSRSEAKQEVKRHPQSFLAIDRPETQFDENFDMYSDEAYQKADEMLCDWTEEGIFIEDEEEQYYIWELTMNGRAQTGLVACSSVDDYLNHVIRKHENTRKDKELDRTRHIDATSAQTGPIFLAYKNRREINDLILQAKTAVPWADFTAEDGVRHRVWEISDQEQICALTSAFAGLENTYIADGHHRAASAVSTSLKRRENHPDWTGKEEFNYFLSVLFPDDELWIMDYNRVLKDLSGYTAAEILRLLEKSFYVEEVSSKGQPFRPTEKGTFGFYVDRRWYRLTTRAEKVLEDPVGCLDVEYLQREALLPIWKIYDPRTDPRIDFVGGIRGIEELERRCERDCSAAFSLYPTSMQELFRVADNGLLMPPKSTWFEPKLRSGMFIHKIER